MSCAAAATTSASPRRGFAIASSAAKEEGKEDSSPISIPARSRKSLLGLLSLPRQQAAARAAASGESDPAASSAASFFALCYADAGVAEALRSLGVDAEVLARDASVALLCDLEGEQGGGGGGDERAPAAMA